MKNHSQDTARIVAYYDSISAKIFDPIFWEDGHSVSAMSNIESILSQNKDMEPYVIQSSSGRTAFFNDPFAPLQFVHFSDLHAVLELWNRISEYINHYSDTISFALHTGDYCGDSQIQYKDCYEEGLPCDRPILNCVGNHDTIDHNWELTPKEATWRKLFNHTENWDVTFMECAYPTAYFKDFPDSNIRLIVLDLYYDVQPQKKWLKQLLLEARERGLHVITATHELSAPIIEKLDVTFQSLTPYDTACSDIFDSEIAAFIAEGGTHICNLCGHLHSDWFGYTENSVLNVAVECASDWAGWCDGKRVRGTRTYDSFNVVTVDTNLGLLKLVRIGNNSDYFLRSKRTLCYDYRNRKTVSNT